MPLSAYLSEGLSHGPDESLTFPEFTTSAPEELRFFD